MLARRVFDMTVQSFAKAGTEDRESVAYWLGDACCNRIVIDDLILASDLPEFESETYHATVPLQSAFAVGQIVHSRNKMLLVQVHSHPAEAYHSLTDDMNPITHEVGFLSVVVPYFGIGIHDLTDCRIYEHLGYGRWRELDISVICLYDGGKAE